jgi:hypothetical protein
VADRIVLPDYRSSIVNIVSSVEASYGLAPLHPPLARLDPLGLADRSAIVLVVLDGLGHELLELHRARAPFLAAHALAPVTSVYPSTTAAAITSLMSGMTPLEHGALGWSLFFKELGAYVDFLPFRDSVDGERLSRADLEMDRILRVRNVFGRIAAAGGETVYLAPRFIVRDQFADESSEPARRVGARSTEGVLRRLPRAARVRRPSAARPRFVFCYCPEPDHTVHRKGTGAPETADAVAGLDRLIERACRRLAGSGATVIVTADHGLTDTPDNHWLDQDPAVYRSLILPPFPEKRFLSFHVKADRRDEFPGLMARYGNDFRLLRRDELLAQGILGTGEPHAKVDDFLGDFVALATGGAQMHTRIVNPRRVEKKFVAHHAGLRREEMLVPLVRIDT